MRDPAVRNSSLDHTVSLRDVDGSLTGEAGLTVVKKGQNITEGLDCRELEGWNMLGCRQQFVRVSDRESSGILSWI